MKHLKMLGIAAVATMPIMVFAVGNASATTLEVAGVAQNTSAPLTGSLTPGTKLVIARTDGSLANECEGSHLQGATTSPFTVADPAEITASVESLSFTSCTRPLTVHRAGVLHIAHQAGTTNGTVTSSGAEWTAGSPFGTLTCKTGAGVDIGTLTGATTASNPGPHAVIDINAILNCGFLVPSASYKGTYIITAPTDFGVAA